MKSYRYKEDIFKVIQRIAELMKLVGLHLARAPPSKCYKVL